MKTTAIVLAAGRSTRMNSKKPKVLHHILGRPMAFYALEAAQQASGVKPVAIIGHEAEMVQQALGDKAEYVIQEPQLGTGHAVQQAEALLATRSEYILVTTADMPLLTGETLQRLIQAQQAHNGPMTLLTVTTNEARGFGRIVRDADGHIQAIIEEAHATPQQLTIQELNTSVYCFTAEWLWRALPRIPLITQGGILPDRPGGHRSCRWAFHSDDQYPGSG